MSLDAFDDFADSFRSSGGRFSADLRFEVPERFNFARDVLDHLASDGDKLAIWWIGSGGGERKVTFAEIAEQSRRACTFLTEQGVRQGDSVVVLLPRVVEWWVLSVACLRMGAVISPGPTQLREADIEHRLRRTGARCVVAHAEVTARVDAVAARCPKLRSRIVVTTQLGTRNTDTDGATSAADGGRSPSQWVDFTDGCAGSPADFVTVDSRSDDTAAIYFTSGTEGEPKMVAHTHVSFPLRSKLTGVYWLDLHDGELHWNLSDTGWAKAGWSSLYGPWNQGAAVFAVDSPRFDPAKVLELLARYPIATMCAAPTVYRSLLLHADHRPIDVRSLRHCVAAGEPLNPEVIEQWKAATGIIIRDGFGQTESSLLAVNFPATEPRPGSMGKPVPGYDVHVIDAAGNVLGPDEEGDLAVRVSPHRPLGLFKRYVDDAAANAAARRGPWHITGDRAYRDEDGYFWFVSRADDVIISSGYRIGPFEVESALLEHAAVAESAVIASPDAVRGEVVKAVVVLKPGHQPSDTLARQLQDHVKAVTAPYKYPRKIEFTDTLPKTTTGKTKRAALRRAERDAGSTECPVPGHEPGGSDG
jgi:acetyl-CoA synthetase/medium-chain acyl-CoA synthetase